MVDFAHNPEIPIASLNDIHLVDGDVEVLKGVSFDIYPNELLLVSGPSGSGKSSSFRVLTGIEDPKLVTGGSLSLFGQEFTPEQIREGKDKRLGRIAIGLQQNNLDPAMTVRQNLVAWHESIGTNGENPYRRAAELAVRFGFREHIDRVVETLSGGEQSRVAIGRVLTTRPDVLLLDEPTDALDPTSKQKVVGLLRAITRAEGIAIALTSHDIALTRPHADREIVISDGRKVAEFRAPNSTRVTSVAAIAS